MKKYLKIFIFFIALLIVFIIYKNFTNEDKKISYIALGDSIAEGMDSYSAVNYGYTDYISDYLKKNDKLSFYTKAFSKSGYKTGDVVRDIENNKSIEIDGNTIYLKDALKDSDLVTLTIGANNFISNLSFDNIAEKVFNMKKTKKEADEIVLEIRDLIILIQQYAKKQIIVTGYYNPVPRLTIYKKEIDELIKYFNNSLEETCNELGVDYVDIFDVLDGNTEALPNPLNIHPNKYGYELIANEVIKHIE